MEKETIIKVDIKGKVVQPEWIPMTEEEIADFRRRADWRVLKEKE